MAAQPADAATKRMLAIAWINARAYDKALPLLRDDPEREKDASLQTAYGMALLRRGRPAEAERILATQLDAQGEAGDLLVLLGQAQADQKKDDLAIATLRRALAKNAKAADADATLGGIYLRRGRAQEALPHLEAAARLAPGDAAVREQLAQAYQKLGQTELANRELEAARELKARPWRGSPALGSVVLSLLLGASLRAQTPAPPSSAPSVKALLQRARTQMDQKNAAGALDFLRRARAIAPNSEEVLSRYAEAALATRAPLAAIPVLASLVRIAPTVADYRYHLGTALLGIGDAAAAVASLREADRLEPGRSPILVALGAALTRRGLAAEAKPVLQRAVSLEPDGAPALAALAAAEESLGEADAAEDHAQRALDRLRRGADRSLGGGSAASETGALGRSPGSPAEGGGRGPRLPRRPRAGRGRLLEAERRPLCAEARGPRAPEDEGRRRPRE